MTYTPKFKIINVTTVQGYKGPMDQGEIDCSVDPMLALLAVYIAKHYNAAIGPTLDEDWPILRLYDATSMLDWESYDPAEDFGCIFDGEGDPLDVFKDHPAMQRMLPLLTPATEIALNALHKELVVCQFDEDVLDVRFINWQGES